MPTTAHANLIEAMFPDPTEYSMQTALLERRLSDASSVFSIVIKKHDASVEIDCNDVRAALLLKSALDNAVRVHSVEKLRE